MAEGKYALAQKIIDERRQKAIALAAAHHQEVEAKFPQIKNYRLAQKRQFASVSRLILGGDKPPAQKHQELLQLQKESQVIEQNIIEMLQCYGYPADYLKEKFTCPICNDTGFVEGRRCVCLENLAKKQAAREFARTMSIHLPDFADFSLDYYSPHNVSAGKTRNDREQMEFVRNGCIDYANHFDPEHSPSLFFSGATGLGKTFLSLAIAKSVLDQGVGVLYTAALDLFRDLQNDFYNAKRERALSMDQVLEMPLLIIDDLGSEYLNQFVPSALFHIVESRLNHGKPTIINSNLSGAELEKRYGNRVYSRIFTLYRVYRFVGNDVRTLLLKQKYDSGELSDD